MSKDPKTKHTRFSDAHSLTLSDTHQTSPQEPQRTQSKQAMSVTALHKAVDSDDIKACEVLLAAGADVNAADEHGHTPLLKAARKGSEACVSLLLKAGAVVSAVDKYGNTPLQGSCTRQRFMCGIAVEGRR